MKTKNFTTVTLASGLFLWVALMSCNGPQRLVDRGQYDEAIRKAARKIEKNQKHKHVLALEEAFRKATGRDMHTVLELLDSRAIGDLEEVREIALLVKSRQDQLRHLLPIQSGDSKYQATFQFVKIENILRDINQKLLSAYHQETHRLLNLASQRQKSYARQAYRLATKAVAIQSDEAWLTLQSTAREMGTTHVLVQTESLEPRFQHSFYPTVRLDAERMDDFWTKFYNQNPKDITPDFTIQVVLHDLDISPERMIERTYLEQAEVEDGWEYVLDANGNVAKDSLGNDIKQSRVVSVQANILEVMQEKILRIRGVLDILNAEGRIVDSESFEIGEKFQNYASTFSGDERALSNETRRRIGNRPVPFPTDEWMIAEAMERLGPVVREELQNLKPRLRT